jgi:hypothetical protein
MTRRRLLMGTAVVVGLVVGGASVVWSSAPVRAKPVSGSFVGTVSGSDTYVAVVAEKTTKTTRRVLAYVCDGKQIAIWFSAKAHSNHIRFPARSGATVTVDLSPRNATGTIRLAYGTTLRFTATPATAKAGLYAAAPTIGRASYLAGWIVLSDGTERGAFKLGSQVVANPFIDPNGLSVSVVGLGTFTASSIDPTTITSFINRNETLTAG